MFSTRFYASVLTMSLTTPVLADQVFNDDLIISGKICAGLNCLNGEIFDNAFPGQIKIKSTATALDFEDIDANQFTPSVSWRLQANDLTFGGLDAFFIKDMDNASTPFTILAAAPTNAMVLNEQGDVGLGTQLPMSDLHISRSASPQIMLEQNGSGGIALPAQTWSVSGDHLGFKVQDITTGSTPLVIEPAAGNAAIVVKSGGNVGIGTNAAAAPFEVAAAQSFNFMRLTANGAALTKSVDFVFTAGPMGTGQLRYNIVDGDAQEMSLDADGNMVLGGTLTTAGPTCAGGCDRVLDADYDLPSISAYAADMYANGYLPSVGATSPHTAVNLSERQGSIINALEHAHIYISELNTRLKQSDTENADLRVTVKAQEARLAVLEQAVQALTTQ